MKDVATALGLHPSTVSLALRQDPRIPPTTRQRVMETAQRLGYRSNPLVSSLMTYRSRRQPLPYRMELAFVCATETQEAWLKMSEAYRRMWDGARTRAEQLGYALNCYPRRSRGFSAKRFSGILAARNIHGVLIAPMPFSDIRLEVEWERFSVVELGYTLIDPDFHKVVHDYFHGMRLLLRKIRALGHKRVGLILPQHADEKVHHLWRAAYLDEQALLPRGQRLAAFIRPDITQADFREWIYQHKPDALITVQVDLVHQRLKQIGSFSADNPRVFSLGCYHEDDINPGIYQDYESMGAIAVEQLIGMVMRAERGVPTRSIRTQVSGIWVPGGETRRA